MHQGYGIEPVRILLSSLIALIVIGANVAVAQQKIDCSKMKFSISLPFQECTVEPNASKSIDAHRSRARR